MKHLLLSLVILCMALTPISFGSSENDETLPPTPRNLRYPPLHFEIPKPHRAVLKNGMVLYLYESHATPSISMRALVRTGSAYDPNEKDGLANLTLQAMRAAGTKHYPSEELDKTLEYLAASFSVQCAQDKASLSAWSLKKNFPALLDVFADVLKNPVFEKGKFNVEKGKILESLRRVGDTPRVLTRREWLRLTYGSNPLGRPITGDIGTLSSLSPRDANAFHRRYFFPKNVILSLSGDFDAHAMKTTLEKAFHGWKNRKPVPPLPTPSLKDQHAGTFYLPKDLTQTSIRLGNLSFARNNPDWFAVQVMNNILGGGSFSSRITQSVRVNAGLAYSAGSRFVDLGDKGYFFAGTQTKAKTTKQALDLILHEIKLIQDKNVTSEELAQAKNSYLNRFVFQFETPRSLVDAFADREYEGLPDNYFADYRKNITQVSEKDVRRVAKKYIHLDALTILVVGKSKAFDVPVDAWGGVQTLKLKGAVLKDSE